MTSTLPNKMLTADEKLESYRARIVVQGIENETLAAKVVLLEFDREYLTSALWDVHLAISVPEPDLAQVDKRINDALSGLVRPLDATNKEVPRRV